MAANLMDQKGQNRCLNSPPSLGGFYAVGAASTILGILVVLLLNWATPMGFIHDQIAHLIEKRSSNTLMPVLLPRLGMFLILNAAVCALVFLAIYVSLKPIDLALRQGDQTIPETTKEAARRRLLNLPFIFIALHTGLWVIIPFLFFLGAFLIDAMELKTSVVFSLRASMVGFVASSFAFYGAEAWARKALIPFFFPEGRLTEVKGAARISVARRIRMFYRLGSGVPVGILFLTLITLQMEVDDTLVSASTFGRGILIFVAVLSFVFLITSGILNRMVTRAIVEPIDNMLKLIGRVRDEDYDVQIPVVSNDEIGVLGDAGNVMIRGLAERARIHTAFGRYVTPEIRDEILAGRIPFHGERRYATVLFSDLRGFTPFVEDHSPEEVMTSLREYFTSMHACIRDHRGLVLQFAGDQIEAVFGVPIPFEEHADAAIQAALAMREALEALNSKRAGEGKATFAHGIGIHSGKVLVGNSGSEEQSAYALIGNAVNVASRIEKLTKDLKSDILVTNETLSAAKGIYPAQPRGDHRVKGYSKSVFIYAVE